MANPTTWTKLSEEISGAIEHAGRSVVSIQSRHRHGSSGVIWRPNLVVTADHTVRRESEPTVILEGGKSVAATLLGHDPTTDLAVLKLSTASNLIPAEAVEPAELKVGQLVVAVGRTWRGSLVASDGILSGLMGAWRTWHGGEIDRFIRPDLTMYPGFSGSALVDPGGKALGLNTTGLRRGTCITIPPTTLNRVVDELLEKGHIARPYLGLAMQPVRLPESLRSRVNLSSEAGLLVVHVEPNGPADQAGVTVGDILIGLGGGTFGEASELQEQLHGKQIGDRVELSVIRGGTRTTIIVSVGEYPVG